MADGNIAILGKRLPLADGLASVLHLLRNPALQADRDALLFSAKSFAAAMLAYYIALRIGLPRPYWAVLTVYIVSQTSAGASLSRGVYRLAGTIIGAVATVAIVPAFVSHPLVCSVVLAGWIGLCLFFSLLDRTPRAYAFVLAGYTASLIGFPGVADPGAIFDTASLRVQEISIGILCAVLVHRFVLPKHMTGQFLGKLHATLLDARKLSSHALKGAPKPAIRRDRYRLSADLLMLQGLGTHLPYDPAPTTPSDRKLQHIHDRLARLLPLATEVEERVHALDKAGALSDGEVEVLLRDAADWIALTDMAERDQQALPLIERARAIGTRLADQKASIRELLAANLAGHLAELVGLLHDCHCLSRAIATWGRNRPEVPLNWSGEARGYVYHRDPWMAGRTALGAVVGIVIGCAFWIWSAWPDGGLAVSLLGVACALFGNVDAPAPNVVKYIGGSVYGVAISLAYSFVILPRVTDFGVLVAVLAPAFLLGGSLQARPATTYKALGITLTIPILAGLGSHYGADFAEALNSVVALFAALLFAVVSMSMFQTVRPGTAINRLRYLNRTDVARRARGRGPDEAGWTSLMIDRTALLLPKLETSRHSTDEVLAETIRHLRLGHVAGQLFSLSQSVGGKIGCDLHSLLSTIATRGDAPVEQINALITSVTGSTFPERERLLSMLIDLRFALSSAETPNAEEAA
ncbi:FUSC family protein [Sphingobium lignivorans]|uniref:Membrane protein YccC n=1 Tax=Sphingobium lignivorans TaxID=2735886 RepID=A0ABR6NHD2_9SPHN|nr:FUSC family protein [Sphingobium lignivorans]MBB5986683.1 putative membrane protein YccC [Sphingobium lignivorans]